MTQPLIIYNTLHRQKELFVPLHAPHVGMYVCGPTVYGDPHLGHTRPAITFDVLFRYLQHIGYKVRYVRNITDVGHLEHDADEGEDKIAKKARLEQLEPMEVAMSYTNRSTKASLQAAYNELNDAYFTLNAEKKTFETDKWYYIVSTEYYNYQYRLNWAWRGNQMVYACGDIPQAPLTDHKMAAHASGIRILLCSSALIS